MKTEDCKSYVNCNASICFLDKDSLANCIWYSDEEICRTMHSPLWIKQQKKIKKRCKNTDTYFTYEMLKQNFVVRTGIEGLSPDKERSPQLKQWLKNHRGQRILTDKEKRDVAKRLKKGREISQLEIGV